MRHERKACVAGDPDVRAASPQLRSEPSDLREMPAKQQRPDRVSGNRPDARVQYDLVQIVEIADDRDPSLVQRTRDGGLT